MANQGLLAQNKPAANTNTLFYSAHVDKSASTMINVANDGTASDYSVALKNYDQKLVVNGSANAYKLHEYDVITAYKMTVNTAFDPAAQGFLVVFRLQVLIMNQSLNMNLQLFLIM